MIFKEIENPLQYFLDHEIGNQVEEK